MVLDFDPYEIDDIFEYWKEHYGKRRFDEKKNNQDLHDQFYMSVIGKDGKTKSVEQFLEDYKKKEVNEGLEEVS